MYLRLVVSLVLVMLTASVACAEEIVIGSGTTLATGIFKPVKGPFERATGHSLAVTETSPEEALRGVVEGKLSAAVLTLTMDESREAIRRLGLPSTPLASSLLGSTRMVVIINEFNPINVLTREQIKGLMSGKIEAWDEIGGPDIPVLIILGRATSGLNSFYYRTFLDGAQVPQENVATPNTGVDVRREVYSAPEAIALVAASIPDSTVKVPEQPAAIASIFLYTRGPHSPAVKQLVNYIKGPGQAYIKK